MDDDGRQLYARIAQGAGEYLRLADEVANRASEQGVSAEQEGELSTDREAVLSVMGQFAALQDVKATAALDEIALVRERMTEGLVAMAILTALILTVLALLTTRSVSGPTQTLVRTAGALIAGDWKPALALAPRAGINDSRRRNELTRLAHAFGSAAVALERREQRLQESNERIQAQNEELQAQNEEIQTQSEELQSQHEEIQAQNEQLLQQGEELRRHVAQLAEADAHKNHFLGVLAHELRNPMTPITNSVYILRHTEPGSDGAKRARPSSSAKLRTSCGSSTICSRSRAYPRAKFTSSAGPSTSSKSCMRAWRICRRHSTTTRLALESTCRQCRSW